MGQKEGVVLVAAAKTRRAAQHSDRATAKSAGSFAPSDRRRRPNLHHAAFKKNYRERRVGSRSAQRRICFHRALAARHGCKTAARQARFSKISALRATRFLNALVEHSRRAKNHRSQSRRKISGSGKIWPRSDRSRAQGKTRSGDRPRRRNSPGDPGAVAPDQEQSGADRRARRRQDRHRRRAGAAHRQRRRARGIERKTADRARSRRAGRRRKVSRRVRRPAESRAQRSHRSERPNHSIHRRAAHPGRRRRRRRRHGRVEHAQAGARARRAALRRRDDAG